MAARIGARAARLLAVLVLVVTSGLAVAGPASAGGPTSVILVAPGSEKAAALYYSDPDYQQLETLLAEPADTAPSPDTPPADGSGSIDGSGYVTVTWLVHDVSIWRMDRIFPGRNGEHLIVTQLMDGTTAGADGMYPGQLGGDTAVRHRSADPVALQALLDRLGLTAAAQPGIDGVALRASSDPAEVAATAEPPGPAATAWWVLAALLVGAALSAGVIRYLPAVRRRVVDEPDAAAPEPVQMVRLPM